MKTKSKSPSQFPFRTLRALISLILCLGLYPAASALAQAPQENSGIEFGQSYHNDVSPALRDLPALWPPPDGDEMEMREANLNPMLPLPQHIDVPDPVVDHGVLRFLVPDAMPATILSFNGIPFPGVGCSCAPPDTNGAVGLTQYVQIVNEGYQVFNKATGASVLGPIAIPSIWAGFGGVCETNGSGDPVVLYDHLANRWLISQFAGTSIPTDECIAISTTSDATGTYNRYGFHLGSNFFDYPHIGVWPDGYYMSMNVFNSGGTALLGPQAFALTARGCSPACPPLSSARESREDRANLPSCPATSTAQFCRLPAPPIPLSRSRAAVQRSTRSDFSTPISSRPLTPLLLSSAVRRRGLYPDLSRKPNLCAPVGGLTWTLSATV